MDNEQIKQIFVRHGFKLRNDAGDDLKPYVYEAARALIAAAVEPAQKCHKCGHDWHHDDCVNVAPKEPAQAVPVAWLIHDTAHMTGMTTSKEQADYWLSIVKSKVTPLYTVPPAISEPAQAVGKVVTVGGYPDDSQHTVEWLVKHKYLSHGQLLYTAPPAIDDEIRKSILELCRLTILNGAVDGCVTAAMEERAEKIQESLGVDGKQVEEELKGIKTAFTESELRAVYDRLGTVQDKPKHGRQA